MSDLVLYDSIDSPYAHRVRLVLAHKNVAHRRVSIDVTQPPPWFRGLSPYGKVPALTTSNGLTLYESAIINEYLDEVFPDPLLMPPNPGLRAQVRIWTDYCDRHLAVAHFRLLLGKGTEAQLNDVLRFMETHGLIGPFWLGPSPSLVDLNCYPFF